MKKNITISILVVALIISVFFISNFSHSHVGFCKEKYPFINFDLNCDDDPQKDTVYIANLTQKIVDNMLSLKKADRISVFYRNLDNRQWFGVKENESFAPGSLIKLPLAVAYYKLAEIDSDILEQKYEYKPQNGKDLNELQQNQPSEEIAPGSVYSTNELISKMIVYSDNNPVPILLSSLDQKFFNKVYIDLGVYIPTSGGVEQDFVSVKTYGTILRQLYNASYLNQFYSNKLLAVMGESSFKSGITAGVPSDVKVANKFGERIITDPVTGQTTNVELHDCGIVYKKENHYILCVMTQGRDYEALETVIAKISKSIYENSK